MAWIGPSASSAFSVINRGCASGNYSFPHELGHNFGARHNPETDPGIYPYAYGHGYNRAALGIAGDRDVMSYAPGTRIAYLSNPNVLVGGMPMGDAGNSDVARVINQNAATIANFMQSVHVAPPAPMATAISVAGTGDGEGAIMGNPSDPHDIDCGAVCSASYPVGTTVPLIATPEAGSVFSGWSGACAGHGVCTVSMSADRSVTATFTALSAGNAHSNYWVQRSYVAYYGRPADPAGLAYWATRMDNGGGSLAAIVGSFGASDEFNSRYGGLSYAALVTKIYQQTLGRDPDQGGLDYYVGELQAGRRTLQSIALDVLDGATGADALTVTNRLDVANHYTGKVAMGCPYGTQLTGVASLTPVTSGSAAVWTAKLGIESRCGPS